MRTAFRSPRLVRTLFAAGTLAALPVLGGCEGTMSVRGKVVPGDIGIVTIVPNTDERVASTDGLAGVKVELRKASTVIASVVSGPDGSFSTKLNRRAAGTRYDVVASGDGIYPVRSTSYTPTKDQVMLIVADERGGAARP